MMHSLLYCLSFDFMRLNEIEGEGIWIVLLRNNCYKPFRTRSFNIFEWFASRPLQKIFFKNSSFVVGFFSYAETESKSQQD